MSSHNRNRNDGLSHNYVKELSKCSQQELIDLKEKNARLLKNRSLPFPPEHIKSAPAFSIFRLTTVFRLHSSLMATLRDHGARLRQTNNAIDSLLLQLHNTSVANVVGGLTGLDIKSNLDLEPQLGSPRKVSAPGGIMHKRRVTEEFDEIMEVGCLVGVETRVKMITIEESLELQREHTRSIEVRTSSALEHGLAIQRMQHEAGRSADIAESLASRMQDMTIDTDSDDDDDDDDITDSEDDLGGVGGMGESDVYDEGFEEEG
ncbi:hypothetical protein BC938DRAFT_476054 [Jimgerdemannia flammicorona]|uniref:Uncharacterized protein n=1 Tax=Jimgerdemannia flammicorona TaxID=994334 RepID=A0A433QQY3_9FUNG|nr:hypothetical protein BC938DRAFT_476054 [Jimgerdemannia flammicorona]